MCDQPPLLIDHIGITVAPDLQPTDDIPDQLEIHIGDGDTGISAGPGDGNGQVGLGFVAKVHRTERDLAGQRIDEEGVVGVIRPAGDHIHGQPGHLELFLAGRVELSQFGDRRHLAQQPHIVEAALIDTAGGPLPLRGPADLAFDLTDELRDLLCRGVRLLLLQPLQNDQILAVAEGDFDAGVDQQRRAHQPDEQK